MKVEFITIKGTWRGQSACVIFRSLGRGLGHAVSLRVGKCHKHLRVDKWTKPCATVADRLLDEWLKPPKREVAARPKTDAEPASVLRIFGSNEG